MLQTSLDKTIHLPTLKHLATVIPLANFYPAPIADCFNAFIGCIKVVNGHEVVIVQGLGELAMISALCFFNTVSHILVTDPTSSAIEDTRRHYVRVFPTRPPVLPYHERHPFFIHSVPGASVLPVE